MLREVVMTYEFKNEAVGLKAVVAESSDGMFWLFLTCGRAALAPECYVRFATVMRLAKQFTFGVSA